MNRPASTTLSHDKLGEIAAMYGVVPGTWGAVESGYRNSSYSFRTADGQWLNFILYKREPDSPALIKRTNALGAYLHAKGLPVRAPFDERVLRVGGRYGSLYSYLEGETIPWEAYTMKHIKLLGLTMARFHELAKGFDDNLPAVEDIYAGIWQRLTAYFADENVITAVQQKLQLKVVLPRFEELLLTTRSLPGRTALHLDMVRSNLLFRPVKAKRTDLLQREILQVGSVELSGVLDLEKAAYGHPVFDVARTLAFLLVDCTKPESKVRKYFLVSGFRKRGGGAQFEPELLEQLVTMFLTYDFYKFLKQNPYESLPENHHFLRTVSMLKARKVLQ